MDPVLPAPSAIVPRDQAMATLADFLGPFQECLDEAWQFVEQVFTEQPDRRAAFTSTTRANMMYDRLAQLIRQRLDGSPRVVISNRGRMLLLTIDAQFLVRFKKLDSALRAHNVHTDSQRLDYFQMQLPGMEEPVLTKLTFGYRLNESATEILGRYVTCPKSWKENHWSASIDEASSDAMPLFTPPTEPAGDSSTGIVVRAKRAVSKKGSASA